MRHLQIINQTYCEHFKDSITYGLRSWKASIYFFIHAFFPDFFQFNGSETIFQLYNDLSSKMEKSFRPLEI